MCWFKNKGKQTANNFAVSFKLFSKMCWSRMGLLHPEEKPNYSQTMTTPNLIDNTFNLWCANYDVPIGSQGYFKNQINITLDNTIPAAETYSGADGIRFLRVNPIYCNAGVLAHEQAHNSYALLSAGQKVDFSLLFDSIKNTDAKLLFLWKINTYGLTSDVEGHAEIYRYWGSEMPAVLIPYYPKLF